MIEPSDDTEVARITPERLVPELPRRVWREQQFAKPVPEALAAPAIVYARHDEIDGDPYNIRESLPSVQRIAWSIYMNGLLENLIVVEHPSNEKRLKGLRFELRAGSRRYEAIRQLIDGLEAPPGSADRENGILWFWPKDRLIPVLVLGSEGHYEHMIENIERSEPLPWEIGRRLSEVLSAGISTRELGTRLGRSNGWVTRYAHIGRGLSPELIDLLKRDKADLKLGPLAQLAAIRDQFGDPDGPEQLKAYAFSRSRRRRPIKRVEPTVLRAIMKRLQYMRSDMPVPPLLRPVVGAVVTYLEGGERPSFKQIETQLFERLKTFSPDIEET